MEIKNPFTGKDIKRNPWTKKDFNLTEQVTVEKADPVLAGRLKAAAPAIDAEEQRKKYSRNLQEFNEMDTAGKVKFIQNGGEITQ
jgi:hypothetical protein